MTGLQIVGAVAVVVGVAAAVWALDRLGLWMERRGWVYWRKKRASGGSAGIVAGLQAFVEPQMRYVIESRQERQLLRREDVAGAGNGKTR